jgi:hypothetical protein
VASTSTPLSSSPGSGDPGRNTFQPKKARMAAVLEMAVDFVAWSGLVVEDCSGSVESDSALDSSAQFKFFVKHVVSVVVCK